MIDTNLIPWSEKHRPKSVSEIKGQETAIEKIQAFLRTFPAKKSVILHGTPGTGKTSLAYAIAADRDAEILELNASDLRNKDKISSIIGPATQQKSLFKKHKIILVDEVDGVSATRDYGGLGELLALVEKSAFPLIITANDIWQKKFNLLRNKSVVVELKEVDYKVIRDILRRVCEEENCALSEDLLTSIAIRAKGDMRAALNDLQILSKSEGEVKDLDIGERNKEQTIFSALQHVFKNARIDEKMIGVFDEVNMPVDEIFLWLEENIPEEYKGEELARAFDALSKADVFRGRIRRQRHWRFMVYEYFFLGPGIASAKPNNRTGWTSYKKPSRILKIWMNNQRTAKKKSICEKYSKHTHISIKTAMKDFMLLKIILQNQSIRKTLQLTQEEITYLDAPVSA